MFNKLIKEMNFKWDIRTFKNVAKTPFIIFVRMPLVLFMRFIEWSASYFDVIADKLPAWNK